MLTLATAAVAGLGAVSVSSAQAAVAPVDPYQPYVKPGCLSFVEQPGVRQFRDMILARAGGSNGGIHACSGYEHGEGRAWDWMMDAPDPAEAAQVRRVLDWLLATDAAGNGQAMARRLGLSYIIWNRRVISFYPDGRRTWRPYSCNGTPGSCHTNHTHFAFSWAGARQQTTWFTTPNRPGDWYPDTRLGSVSHQVRQTDGTWTGFASLGLGAASRVAAAVDPGGGTHVVAIAGGIARHRLRAADGSWTPWGNLGGGPATAVSAATDADGTLHVAAVLDGQVYHRVRFPDWSWTPWGSLGTEGASAVAGAVDQGTGGYHLLAVIDGRLLHRVRFADGSWTPWGALERTGLTSVTAATDNAGTLHVSAVSGGEVLHRVRLTDGSWTPWGGVGGGTAVAASVDRADQGLHLVAVIDGQVNHRVRFADGSWTPWDLVGNTGTAAAVTASTEPGGALHVVAVH
jgi:hypothetical protein